MDASCDSTSSLAPHSNIAQSAQDDITTVTAFALNYIFEELRLNRHLSHPLDLATIQDWPSSMTASAKLLVARGREIFEAGLTMAVREHYEGFVKLSEDILQLFHSVMSFPAINVLLLKMMMMSPGINPRAPFNVEEIFFVYWYYLGRNNPIEITNWIRSNIMDIAVAVYGKAASVLLARLPH